MGIEPITVSYSSYKDMLEPARHFFSHFPRYKLVSESMLVEVAAITGIAASLYRNGGTVHSLLGLGVEDKDASEQHAKISRYGPQSQRAAILRKVQLCIIDESSMMQRILFEHVDAVLKDIWCLEQARDGTKLTSKHRSYEYRTCRRLPEISSTPVVHAKTTIRNDDRSVALVRLLDDVPWR